MFKDGISENLMKYVGRFYDDSCYSVPIKT